MRGYPGSQPFPLPRGLSRGETKLTGANNVNNALFLTCGLPVLHLLDCTFIYILAQIHVQTMHVQRFSVQKNKEAEDELFNVLPSASMAKENSSLPALTTTPMQPDTV